MQQRLQIQQCFTTDGGHRRQAHSAAGRRIEHPLRNLQQSSFEVLFDAAAEQCAPISGEGLVDRHNPVVPRMPRVMDFSRFSTMGVALSTCITRTGLISALGRTPPAVVQWRLRLRAAMRSSRCHDSAACITATRSQPESTFCGKNWTLRLASLRATINHVLGESPLSNAASPSPEAMRRDALRPISYRFESNRHETQAALP